MPAGRTFDTGLTCVGLRRTRTPPCFRFGRSDHVRSIQRLQQREGDVRPLSRNFCRQCSQRRQMMPYLVIHETTPSRISMHSGDVADMSPMLGEIRKSRLQLAVELVNFSPNSGPRSQVSIDYALPIAHSHNFIPIADLDYRILPRRALFSRDHLVEYEIRLRSFRLIF